MIDYDKYRTKGAYHWQWYDDPNYAWYKECVDRCVEFCKGSTLDFGCGDGVVIKKINDKGFDVLGVDDDTTALDFCKNMGIEVHKTDLNAPFGMIDYDYLCCLNTIEHLRNTEYLVTYVRDVKKGAIIITDKATEHKGRYHEHEYTKEELLETFKEFKPKYFEINSTEFGKPITFIGVEITK